MEAWKLFWGGLLALTLIGYSVLVIYVTIGGFSDIKQMFKVLGGDNDDADDNSVEDGEDPK